MNSKELLEFSTTTDMQTISELWGSIAILSTGRDIENGKGEYPFELRDRQLKTLEVLVTELRKAHTFIKRESKMTKPLNELRKKMGTEVQEAAQVKAVEVVTEMATGQDPRLSDDPLTALAAVMRHHDLFLRVGTHYDLDYEEQILRFVIEGKEDLIFLRYAITKYNDDVLEVLAGDIEQEVRDEQNN